jgi:hypothetical protein
MTILDSVRLVGIRAEPAVSVLLVFSAHEGVFTFGFHTVR